jgi:hypothetical protein
MRRTGLQINEPIKTLRDRLMEAADSINVQLLDGTSRIPYFK